MNDNCDVTSTTISSLQEEDAPRLARLIAAQEPHYLRMFFPFPFDEGSLRARLRTAKHDRYWGLWHGGELAGFFMLRGWDTGYVRPSFGVFVAEAAARRGLASRAIDYALAWARENGVREVMLKVDPENIAAVRAYSLAGFVTTDSDPVSGHQIMVRKETAP